MSENVIEKVSNNRVGPILRCGEVAEAAKEALQIDNPGKEFHCEDRMSYVRIECDGECILTAKTMSEILGRPFLMRELEINLCSFAGQVENFADHVRFYYNTKA